MSKQILVGVTEANIVKHSNHFVKIYYSILKEFEKYPDTKGIRTFTLLPHKHGFTQSHITICNTGLENTLKYIAKKLKVENSDVESGLDVKKFSEKSSAITTSCKFVVGMLGTNFFP